jgi:hypothetical protein
MQLWLRAEAARLTNGVIRETPEQIMERVERQLELDVKEGRVLFE